MNFKLVASLISPFVLAVAVVGVSRPIDAAQRRQKPTTYIRLGVGEHEEPTVNPELPVLRHDVEHYYDRPSDRIMTVEVIEYEDGSAATKLGPHRPEFDPQVDPRLDTQPVPCTLVVQSATVQGNAQNGTCHVDASVLCRKNGDGVNSCPRVGFSLTIYQFMPNGSWLQINASTGQSPSSVFCNTTVRPFADSGVSAPGTFRFVWRGWDTSNLNILWTLATEFTYAG